MQGLEDAELREQRLAARRRHFRNDRHLGRVQESSLQQCGALRGEKLEDGLMVPACQRPSEL